MHKHFFVLSLLLLSSRYSNSAEISILLKEIEMKDLARAIEEGRVDSVRNFLDNGAPIYGYFPKKYTPFFHAIWKATTNPSLAIEIVKLFLDRKADPNYTRPPGFCQQETPITHSCCHSITSLNVEPLLKTLIKYGANLNQKNAAGDTPLHECAQYRNIKVIKALLQFGANPFLKNNVGKTPYDRADIDDIKEGLRAGEAKWKLKTKRTGGRLLLKSRRRKKRVPPVATGATSLPDTPWPTWNEAHDPQADQTKTSPHSTHFPIM